MKEGKNMKRTEKEKAYIAFMYDESNIMNCDECPENLNRLGQRGYPCGQQNCWVAVHVDHSSRMEDIPSEDY